MTTSVSYPPVALPSYNKANAYQTATSYQNGVNTSSWTVNPLTSEYNQTNNVYTSNILNPHLIHNHTNNDWIRNIFSVDFVYDTVHNNYQTNKYDLGSINLGGNTTYGYTPGVSQNLGNNYNSGYGNNYNSGYGNNTYNNGYSVPSYTSQGSYSDKLSELVGSLLGRVGSGYSNPYTYAKPAYQPSTSYMPAQQRGGKNSYGINIKAALMQLVDTIISVLGRSW